MPARGQPIVDQLIAEAEAGAERTISFVRIAVAITLALSVFALVDSEVHAQAAWLPNPLLVMGAALIGFITLSVSSLVLASTGRFRPWMAFIFTAFDVAVVASGLSFVLLGSGLSGNWLAAVPALWVIPLLLAVGALRYRPSVQIFATALFTVAAIIVTAVLGFDPVGPAASTAEPSIRHFFSLGPITIRLVLVALTGAVVAVVMTRARRLLVSAVRETSRRTNLSRFLPPEIAPLVEADRFGGWREGRRQRVAILFVDIRNSTGMAEAMDPKRLSVFISSFRRRVLRAAEWNGGVIDKFIGDGALVLFGIPEPRPDDAKRALACARELLRRIERWNEKRRFDPPVRLGIGVHVGEVYCGLVGTETRLEFTVLGDAVNVAARVEQASKELGLPLLATAPAVAAAGELAAWRLASAEPLRGRTAPVDLLTPSDVHHLLPTYSPEEQPRPA